MFPGVSQGWLSSTDSLTFALPCPPLDFVTLTHSNTSTCDQAKPNRLIFNDGKRERCVNDNLHPFSHELILVKKSPRKGASAISHAHRKSRLRVHVAVICKRNLNSHHLLLLPLPILYRVLSCGVTNTIRKRERDTACPGIRVGASAPHQPKRLSVDTRTAKKCTEAEHAYLCHV